MPSSKPGAPHPALDAVRDCTCFNLRKATRAVTQYYDEALRPTGLRVTQFSLLGVIAICGRASITELAQEAVMDRTTLTRNLALLEQEGLIRIEPGEDARVRQVSLTPAARPRLLEAHRHWATAQAHMTEALGQAGVRRLLADLAGAISAVQPR
jgi:DNA-binding MarR family transcriptional regulator